MKTRAELTLRHYQRCALVLGLDEIDKAAEAAYATIEPVIDEQADGIIKQATDKFKGWRSFKQADYRGPYDEAFAREKQRIRSELRLWEAELRRRGGRSVSGATNVTITGSYNVVQAGIAGSATIVIDAQSREAIADALRILRDTLAADTALSPPSTVS